MTNLTLEVIDARPEPHAAVPTIMLRMRIAETTGATVHAIALRCQIRIEPQRRRYTADEEARLYELFGETPRWGDSLRPFLWTHVATTVTSFRGTTEVDLPIECTYDFEVAASKYLHAVEDGEIPILLLFTGTVFTKGQSGFAVEPVAWDLEAPFRLPVAVWRDTMDLYFPNSGWIRVSREHPRRAAAVQERTRASHVGPGVRAPPQAGRRGRRVSAAPTADRFDAARAVADAVLYEGYVLYPYRASATKNQLRWQFGVLVPRACSAIDGSERWTMRTECIVAPGATPMLAVRIRCLQVQHRAVECAVADGSRFVATDRLDIDGTVHVPWDEAVEHVVDIAPAAAVVPHHGDARRTVPAPRRSRLRNGAAARRPRSRTRRRARRPAAGGG